MDFPINPLKSKDTNQPTNKHTGWLLNDRAGSEINNNK